MAPSSRRPTQDLRRRRSQRRLTRAWTGPSIGRSPGRPGTTRSPRTRPRPACRLVHRQRRDLPMREVSVSAPAGLIPPRDDGEGLFEGSCEPHEQSGKTSQVLVAGGQRAQPLERPRAVSSGQPQHQGCAVPAVHSAPSGSAPEVVAPVAGGPWGAGNRCSSAGTSGHARHPRAKVSRHPTVRTFPRAAQDLVVPCLCLPRTRDGAVAGGHRPVSAPGRRHRSSGVEPVDAAHRR
jgi:hypothetical protein